MGIIDMLPANRDARGGNPLIAQRQDFYMLSTIERIANANSPGMTIFHSRDLNISSGINEEVLESARLQQMCRILNGPPFDNARRISNAILLNIEIPFRLLLRLFA